MLKLVPFSGNILQVVYDMLQARGRDYSRYTVVVPTKRMADHLCHMLYQREKTAFFPPDMLPLGGLITRLYTGLYPGRRDIDTWEAVLLLFQALGAASPDSFYPGRSDSFAAFYPQGLRVYQALELLLKDGRLDHVKLSAYEAFARLGQYHRDFQEFIELLPRLARAWLDRMEGHKLSCLALRYYRVGQRARAGTLPIDREQTYIFAGFQAPLRAERDVMARFFDQVRCTLVLQSTAGELSEARSIFAQQGRLVAALGLDNPTGSGQYPWQQVVTKAHYLPTDSQETQMVLAGELLKGESRQAGPGSLQRIGVLLAEPSALVPFLQNVVHPLSAGEAPLAFNITLGYPFGRTPLYKLLELMLLLAEAQDRHMLPARQYLELIRHPYVRAYPPGHNSDPDSYRQALHKLEAMIGEQNLVAFSIQELVERYGAWLAEKGTPPADRQAFLTSIRQVHNLYVPDPGIPVHQLLDFMQNILQTLSNTGEAKEPFLLNLHLKFCRQLLHALRCFSHKHAHVFNQSPVPAKSSFIRLCLKQEFVYFQGSPFDGVQVMGMREFAGLPMDCLIVADCLEGILPGTSKYDALLPTDIRRVLGMRTYYQEEQAQAIAFFSLLAATKRTFLLVPDTSGGNERSRFIERLWFQSAMQGRELPCERWAVPYRHRHYQPRSIRKNAQLLAKLADMPCSPGGLELYLTCPLRFYYEKVLGLRERKSLAEETDAGSFGTIAHEVLKYVYEAYHDRLNMADEADGDLDRFIAKAYQKAAFDPAQGIERLRAWCLRQKLSGFIRHDFARMLQGNIRLDPRELEMPLQVRVDLRGTDVLLRGRVDRIEHQEDTWRIIDYKTGQSFSPACKPDRVDLPDALHNLNQAQYLDILTAIKKSLPAFQLLAYTAMAIRVNDLTLQHMDACYVFLREKPNKAYRPVFSSGKNKQNAAGKDRVMTYFLDVLALLVEDMRARETFLANPGSGLCRYCPFSTACGAALG